MLSSILYGNRVVDFMERLKYSNGIVYWIEWQNLLVKN